MKKYAIGLLLFAMFMLFSVSIGVVYAVQCRAGSHTFAGGSQASDQALCIPDVGASGPVKTGSQQPSGPVDKGGYRTTYGQGDERTQETAPSTPSLPGPSTPSKDYSSMSYDELQAEIDRLQAEVDAAWAAEEVCEAPVEAAWQNCINNCDYSTYNCNCYENWVVPWQACLDASDAKTAPLYAAKEAVWAAMDAAWERDYNNGGDYDTGEEEPIGEVGEKDWYGGGSSGGGSTGGGGSSRTTTGPTVNVGGQQKVIYDIKDDSDDSAMLMESLLKTYNNQAKERDSFYSKPMTYPELVFPELYSTAATRATDPERDAVVRKFKDFPPIVIDPTITTFKEAADNFENLRPMMSEVVDLKSSFTNAMSQGSLSDQELGTLQGKYENKINQAKTELQTQVLDKDATNADALWQMGTLSKWQGNNQESYEYYRDAIRSAQITNPFKYQQLTDSLKDPAIRMQILQDLADEKVTKIPTPDISPFMNTLKNGLKKLVQPLDDAYQETARQIEQYSRAFSFSDRAAGMMTELGAVKAGGGSNE